MPDRLRLIFLTALLLLSGAAYTGSLGQYIASFCRDNKVQATYNLPLGYVEISRGEQKARVFLNLPYVTDLSSVRYMPEIPSRDPATGELFLPPATVSAVLDILNRTNGVKPLTNIPVLSIGSSSSASAVETFIITNTITLTNRPANPPSTNNASARTNQGNTNPASAKKDDNSGKTNYNIMSAPGEFKPIDAIILDAGHGGSDPGGIGYRGVREKDIVYSITLMAADILKKKGYRVIMTRSSDVFVSLGDRVKLASGIDRRYNPVFISIHGNISFNKNAVGLEVYSLADKASDSEALSVEMAENQFSRKDIEEAEALFDILGSLLRDGVKLQSESFSRIMADAILKKTSISLRGVKKANFYVLKYNAVPSILVEVGFLSNPGEARKLQDKAFQKKMAEGIAEGVLLYMAEYNRTRGFTR